MHCFSELLKVPLLSSTFLLRVSEIMPSITGEESENITRTSWVLWHGSQWSQYIRMDKAGLNKEQRSKVRVQCHSRHWDPCAKYPWDAIQCYYSASPLWSKGTYRCHARHLVMHEKLHPELVFSQTASCGRITDSSQRPGLIVPRKSHIPNNSSLL